MSQNSSSPTPLAKENIPLDRFIQMFSNMNLLSMVRFIRQQPLPETEWRSGEHTVI